MESFNKQFIILIIFFCGFHGSEARSHHQSSWGPWGAWSKCSKTCGRGFGIQTRVRTWVYAPGDPNSSRGKFTTTDMLGCGTQLPCPVNAPVDGSWSPWSSWGECSAGCGGGTRTRHRDCNNPPPSHKGEDCKGEKYQESACNEDPCSYALNVPVDGSWSPWSSWGECSAGCGGGTRTRHRDCNNPPPSHKGEDCKGEKYQEFACNEDPCRYALNVPVDGSWSPWSSWGECSAGCGGGTRTRHRDCNNPPPSHKGEDCKGEKYQEFACNEDPCRYAPTPATTRNSRVTVIQCDTTDSFLCDNQRMCVSLQQRCDGAVHCSDGSDEVSCPTVLTNYRAARLQFSAASTQKTASILVALAAAMFSWILVPHAMH